MKILRVKKQINGILIYNNVYLGYYTNHYAQSHGVLCSNGELITTTWNNHEQMLQAYYLDPKLLYKEN